MSFWIDNAWVICIVAGSACFTAAAQLWGVGVTIRAKIIVSLMACLGIWAVGNGLVIWLTDPVAKLWSFGLLTLGIAALPPSLLMLSWSYTGQGARITPRNILLLYIPVLLTVGLLLSNPFHYWFITGVHPSPITGQPILEFGPVFWVLVCLYPTLVSLWSLVRLLRHRLEATGPERSELTLVLLGLLLPNAGILLFWIYFWQLGAPDPTPVFFIPTAVIVAWAVARTGHMGLSQYELVDDHSEINFKIQIARSLSIVIIPALTYFWMGDIEEGLYANSIILGLMLATMFSGLIAMGSGLSAESVRRLFSGGLLAFVVLFGVLNLHLSSVHWEGGRILWSLLFPLAAFLAIGTNRGLIVVCLYLLAAIIYGQANHSLDRTFLTDFGLRFLVTYCLVSLAFYVVDRKRRYFLQKTMDQRDALRQASQEWQATFDAMGDAICLVDTDYHTLRCNQAMTDKFGYKLEAIQGRTCHELIHHSQAPPANCPQRAALKSGRRQEQEMQVGGRWLREVADPIKDQSGQITGFVHIIRDITHKKLAEEEKAWLNRQLAQAQKRESLGIVAGGVAHDFNNLLNGILGYNELARRALPPNSPLDEHLEAIAGLSMKAVHLTRKMLDYTGRGKGKAQLIDLSRQVEEMRASLVASAPANVFLDIALVAGLPLIQVDPAQISQVISNLVTNAWESLEGQGGRVVISTGVASYSEEDLRDTVHYENQPAGVYVHLEVADSGPGMESGILEKIFDPFFTTKFPGRGMGLATLSGIVRSHRGAMQVRNFPGEGAVFYIMFPASDEGQVQD